jgi:hypothetical protein
MRTSMAYFAGAGTVVVAIAAGLGGGLLIANMVNPQSSNREMTKLEQRMSSKPIPVSNAPSEPVQYLTETQATARPNAAAAPVQNQPPTQMTTEAPSANNTAANTQQPPSAAQAAAPEQAKAAEEAFAKARDADVKRDARREDRRRGERRQQRTERRRYRDRQDQELRDVELKVREETEPTRAFAPEPARMEMPRIKLFGED